ncbi:DUF805 domain-containing protein [Acidaminococcus timonensis]|uniref:DUF805 domain-containing protein n=1 Tax=Acidaminococcus timonensis TaxID=1871002 RepID=UPI0008D936BA|nr:DUF805 domain-containing protein [Acidaminococcus timonensis]
MKICPKCHKIYEDSQNFCSIDGTELELTPVSQAMRSGGQQPEDAAQPAQEVQPETETRQEQQQQNRYQYRPTSDPSFGARLQANIPDANTWKPMYFSFDGRLSRGDFVCRWLLLVLCAVVVSLLCGVISILAPLGILAFIALCVAQISISVRRLHDRGHSGLWLFVCVIPAANLLMFLYLLFAAGQPGVNEYGAAE